MKTGSRLESLLDAGEFVVTGELGPPRGNDAAVIREKGEMLRGVVDAVNITDNQTAIVRMSSIAAASILAGMGIEPVMQMTARDRNRIAIQSDVLGASALGIRNILCISGDHQSFGNQQCCRNVYDVDSIQMLGMVKRMRDEGKVLGSDDELRGRPGMFIGAAANPFAEPFEMRPLRLKKKVDAGADFIQTQCIFDMKRFRDYMKVVVDMGLHERCHILAGIMPLKSAGMARYMAEQVPGVTVPEHLIRRMAGVTKEKAAEEGIAICCEIVDELRAIDGIKGIHLMAIEWEHRVSQILEKAKLLKQRG
ncbi:MAG: 5,10-methylenetetrahydrofolate reductase [Spirochaetae bacterium HGW-Spirochaetae-1]|jgi:methylenetetrahydrofolate reductase (NADPH)|nr:MAG: 5,10-methylenetetrahydrofolate reductase [Spirochaetae bacterium HGW-Spirochaetae-1]